MDEESLKQPKESKWTSFSNKIFNLGAQITDSARKLLATKHDAASSEYLFDPHTTLIRTYGSLSPYGEYGNASACQSRRGSGIVFDNEPFPNSDGESRSSTPPIVVSPSDLPNDIVEKDHIQKRERNLTIPIVNVHPEQDFNFLTVHSARRYSNGRSSPARKSSDCHSGSASPLLGTSSFDFQNQEVLPPEKFTWGRIIKIVCLVAIFILLASVIISTSENSPEYKLIAVSSDKPYEMPIRVSLTQAIYYPILTIAVKGVFLPERLTNFTSHHVMVDIEKRGRDGNMVQVSLNRGPWKLPILSPSRRISSLIPESTVFHGFNLNEIEEWEYGSDYYVVFRSDAPYSVPLSVAGRLLSQIVEVGAVFGGAVMIGLYILIIFELVNRTLAAMLAAAGAIGCLAAMNERPTTEEMVSWLDMETLILLFSMMVIVAILCETGFFDYASFLMYKAANGQVWPLITAMCFFTAIVSAFLDNVTTILLMTPVTIRICEAMELNPVPVLISIVIFSNIGGAVTPVGDPPNVIISNNKDVASAGIDFATFSLHMLLAIVPVLIVGYLQLRFIFRSIKSLKFSEPYELIELRREIDVWSRAADSVSSYSKDEGQIRELFLSKVIHLQNKLKAKVRMGGQTEENFQANLIDLEASCKIRDWGLLIKCGVVLAIIILLFFLHSIPELNLSIGWTALLGTVFLLILADRREIEGILGRVEWSTLIFFSALFIVMEGVSRLGLLEWIGNQTEAVIMEVNEESRLTVATLLILWVSGLASAFIDNIPFTTMMIQIVTRLADRVSLPLQPLVWALALGTCLGGNGTLIGASANVVAAGVADQHGYKFSFMEYFKIGFPMMIVSLIVSTVYLFVCHSLLGWNN